MVWLAVFLGGGFGSLARYGVGQLAAKAGGGFPLGTLVANVLATALLATSIVLISRGFLKPESAFTRALTIGFCGGFSTFSTFSLETARLLKAGNTMYAVLNIAVSVLACLIIVMLLLRKA